ncbi:MAG: hypothetical protein MJ131_02600 [Lachnospiraceae bacterium]|nr:hypothetical protein [Lachnospiraceae bacterium]
MNKKLYSARLSHDLFEVIDTEAALCDGQAPVVGYGGSQNWYTSKYGPKCGCGVAAAADIIFYLNALKKQSFTVSKKQFIEFSDYLQKKYLQIIPNFGVNSFWLAIGMNRYFLKNKMPYRCYWKVSPILRWSRLEKMLKNDIPVLLAVGNNFPIVWGKKKVNLYRKEADTRMDVAVYSHYVIVTAIDGDWLTISSWGRKYYIRKSEYEAYVRKYSLSMYSNVLDIIPVHRKSSNIKGD